MYSWLVRSLGNISVSLKLGIGFGLVLLLTIVITLTGWLGMASLIERGDKGRCRGTRLWHQGIVAQGR